MKIGIFSDVHGNLEALHSCLSFFASKGIKRIFFLGDAVGYLPFGAEVVKVLIDKKIPALLGNHEAMLLGQLPIDSKKDNIVKISTVRTKIDSEHIKQISSWKPFREIQFDGKKVLLVHGSPWDPLNGYIYSSTDLSNFMNLPYHAVFMGHTHQPFSRKIKTTLVVNVGSCGLPRDQGNLSSCAIFDTKKGRAEIFRFPFDAESLIKDNKERIHMDVVQCLHRKKRIKTFGKLSLS